MHQFEELTMLLEILRALLRPPSWTPSVHEHSSMNPREQIDRVWIVAHASLRVEVYRTLPRDCEQFGTG